MGAFEFYIRSTIEWNWFWLAKISVGKALVGSNILFQYLSKIIFLVLKNFRENKNFYLIIALLNYILSNIFIIIIDIMSPFFVDESTVSNFGVNWYCTRELFDFRDMKNWAGEWFGYEIGFLLRNSISPTSWKWYHNCIVGHMTMKLLWAVTCVFYCHNEWHTDYILICDSYLILICVS